jgi:predicted SAM-dependent methyltransferase
MKYHLGCGSHYMPGYFNVDFPRDQHTVNDAVKADLYDDILTMKYEPCEEIRSHHVFEHFGFVDSFKLLERWTKSLLPKGLMVIDVPDVAALASALTHGSLEKKFKVMRYLYGSQEAPWAYHVNGWTSDMLIHVLREIGYSCPNTVAYGVPDDECPNCGVCVTMTKTGSPSPEEIHGRLGSMLSLYANGDTDFERRLTEHWRSQL